MVAAADPLVRYAVFLADVVGRYRASPALRATDPRVWALLRAEEQRLGVRVHGDIPHLVVHVQDVAEMADGRVRHEDVELGEVLPDLGEHLGDLLFVPHVGADGEALDALGLDFGIGPEDTAEVLDD